MLVWTNNKKTCKRLGNPKRKPFQLPYHLMWSALLLKKTIVDWTQGEILQSLIFHLPKNQNKNKKIMWTNQKPIMAFTIVFAQKSLSCLTIFTVVRKSANHIWDTHEYHIYFLSIWIWHICFFSHGGSILT